MTHKFPRLLQIAQPSCGMVPRLLFSGKNGSILLILFDSKPINCQAEVVQCDQERPLMRRANKLTLVNFFLKDSPDVNLLSLSTF